MKPRPFHALTTALLFSFCTSVSLGQIRITEILADSVDNATSEWIEIQNISGAPLDISGFVYDDDDDNALTAGNLTGENLILPADGIGVLYNSSDFDVARFQSAWNLDPGVPLIGVSNPPRLSNSDDVIGVWSSFENYMMDVADEDEDGDLEVVQFNNAITSIAYGPGFPLRDDSSMAYAGSGDPGVGDNWRASVAGQHGAYPSVQTFLDGIPINSPEDVGNPGKIPEGPLADGLLFSEIMYNPKTDPDNSLEWVEVVNNTGAAINFADSPHYFDDEGGGPLDEPNLVEGSVDQGGVAVLFNSDAITLENMKAIWGEDINFIPVPGFSALNNGGDQIGIWSDRELYLDNKEADFFGDALAWGDYDDDPNAGWPIDDGAGSIYMKDLAADQFVGSNWLLSNAEDGISFNAMEVKETVVDHDGGDVGSPGFFVDVSMFGDGDFDEDGDLDVDDINALTNEVIAGNGDLKFDVNGDGEVNPDDRSHWVIVSKKTWFGDANLDGEFGSADLVAVFQAGEYEDGIAGNSNWSTGDWTGDKEFDTSDLVLAFQDGGFELGPRQVVNAVPEPTSGFILLFVITTWAFARSKP